MKLLIALLLLSTACAAEPVATKLECNPRRASCHLRYAIWPQAPQVLRAGFAPVLADAVAPALTADAAPGDLLSGIGAAFQAKNWPLLATLLGLLALLGARAAAWNWPFIPPGVSAWLHSGRGTLVMGSVIGFLVSLTTAFAMVGHVDWGAVGTSAWSTLGTVVLALLRDAAPSSAKVAAGK